VAVTKTGKPKGNMAELNLDRLSTSEIKRLWQETTAKAKQRAEQRNTEPVTDVTGDGDDYYIDGFGNAIPGKRPEKKAAGTYVDANGYVQELKPGEKAPALSGNGLVDWLNQQNVANDPELKEALGDNLFFEGQTTVGESEILLTGKLESRGWIVDSKSTDPKLNLSFRLSRGLTRDEAIEQSVAYVESKFGPRFKTLSDTELRMAERLAVQNRVSAFVFYLQSRLPDELAEKFLELGAQGNELQIIQFAADEKISELAEEAVSHAFWWSTPRATEQFFDFVRSTDDGRTWTFALLDSLWNQYNVSSAINRISAEPTPTTEDLEAMSDTEIEETLAEARRLRARNRVR
jgi:hypothetical protein